MVLVVVVKEGRILDVEALEHLREMTAQESHRLVPHPEEVPPMVHPVVPVEVMNLQIDVRSVTGVIPLMVDMSKIKDNN